MIVVERLPLDTPPRKLLRAVRARMAPAARRSPRMRSARKDAYRLALDHQAYWRALTDWQK